MIIIPAIDIKDRKCVRLRQGRMDSSTIFNENPVAQAIAWQETGAKMIHLVDLDGSIDGRPANLDVIREIVRCVNIPIELGGGIREKSIAEMYLDIGVSFIILGTVAAKDPKTTTELLERFSGQIAIGIDAKAGNVAVQGWIESTGLDAVELALRYDHYRPASFIYTDIERDGMMVGPNFAATETFAKSINTQVTLSGGVSSLDDVKKALVIEKHGVTGIIIGRALYEGKIKLDEAIS